MSKDRADLSKTRPVRIPSQKQIPDQIGKYLLQKEIGRGTCGVVYTAYDPFVARDVAIKLAITESSMDPGESIQQNREFFAEAHAAGMLHHPHIVSVFDAGVEEGISYIVMEFIDGQTLAELCRVDGGIPVDQAVDILFQCAKALDYSHRRGVLHRDIKPGNIMYSKDGTAKIMDFSIAEVMQGEVRLRPDAVVDSPAFMSPEQVRKQDMRPSSDLYSLGAVAYYLLCGEPPFVAQDIKSLLEMVKLAPPPDPRLKRPELPEVLVDIVMRLLQKDPEVRYQTGQELAADLSRLHSRLREADRQINRSENRDSLRRLRFFNQFDDEQIDEFLNASSMLSFRPGDTIIREGNIDNAFYIIVVGQVKVSKGGKELMTLSKGDVFGEIAFLSAVKRTATVDAQTEVLALKINAAAMEQVSEGCQLQYYKVFCETLIYRLSVTSAKLSAIQ